MTQNYAHRCNADGSFDTIGLHFFQTVDSAPPAQHSQRARQSIGALLWISKFFNTVDPGVTVQARSSKTAVGSLPRPQKKWLPDKWLSSEQY